MLLPGFLHFWCQSTVVIWDCRQKEKQCHVWALAVCYYREIRKSSYVPNSGVNKICLTVTTLTLLVMLKMFLGNEICWKLVFKHWLYAVWTVVPDEVAPSPFCRVRDHGIFCLLEKCHRRSFQICLCGHARRGLSTTLFSLLLAFCQA